MPNLARLRSVLDNLDRAPEILECRRLTSQWPALTSAYLGVRELSYPYLLRLNDYRSLQLHEPGDLVTAWVIFFRGEYQVDSSCRTIVDGGANIGAFTLFALAAAPEAKIWSLEPFPETFHKLELTIARNNQVTRVSTHQVALAPESGTRHMAGGDLPSHKRVLVEEASPQDVSVEALPLGEFLDREGLETLDLLKLDIEGEEHPLLQDTPDEVLKRIGALVMEYHPRAPKEPLFARLIKSGFRLEHDRPINEACGIAHFRR
ncbi:MAG: FkbM family methyltransferase [Planctomycetes bacterium]|nr:FkbM family methyltransferase [Planctomycetota bacterium]